MARLSRFPNRFISWSTVRSAPFIAWLSLALMMLTTLFAAFFVHYQDQILATQRFDQEAQEIHTAIFNQMRTYEMALRSSVGLFSSSDEVTREEWKKYIENLQIDRFYPGIQGIGFIEWLPAVKLAAHEYEMRAEGFTDYRVLPERDSDEYAVVKFLEPFHAGNQRVLGFNQFSLRTSRAAMEQARDSGLPALSGKLELLSENTVDKQTAFHMYWSVYRNDVMLDTVEERRDALKGYIYAPFRLIELMHGIFPAGMPFADLSIYDESMSAAKKRSPENLMYGGEHTPDAKFNREMSINIAGREWLLAFSSTPAFESQLSSSRPAIALIVGAQISTLLFLLQVGSLKARRRERQVADEMARQAKLRDDRFRLVVEAAPNAIVVSNEQGQIELVNEQAENLFGYPREELFGKQVDMLLPECYRAFDASPHEHFPNSSAIEKPLGTDRDLFARCKDGTEIPIEIELNPIHTDEGLLILSSIVDISERKASEARLLDQTEQIAAASRYKSEFVANMSHELRTPLNSILILSEQLKVNSQGNLTVKQVNHADIIHRSGNDLLNLINDILDMSKIEAGRMTLVLEKIVIAGFASSVDQAFRPLAEAKRLAFEVQVDPDIACTIYSDHQRIFQIIRNLVSNALKFTKNGSIQVRFSRVQPASEPGVPSNAAIAIAVIDSGIGIPRDKHNLVFEAFRQVDGSTSRRYGGTGLGLTISRQLANLLGGDIRLDSEVEKGSTFTLFLPSHMPEVQPDQLHNIVSSLDDKHKFPLPRICDQQKTTVLIIADDPPRGQEIADAVRAHDWQPMMAHTFMEGMKIVETAHPAAVILALPLTDINDAQCMREFKSNPYCRHLPIKVISDTKPAVVFDKSVGYWISPIAPTQISHAVAEIHAQLQEPLQRILIVENNTVDGDRYTRSIGEMGYEVMLCGDANTALECCRRELFHCLVIDLNLPGISGFELLKRLKSEQLMNETAIVINTALDPADKQLQQLREYSSLILTKSLNDEHQLSDAVRKCLGEFGLSAGSSGASSDALARQVLAARSFAGKRVLVVDDDIRNIYAMCSLLGEMGVDTVTARNGEESVQYLAQHDDIDLILMDMMMPVMDGYAATRELKSVRHYSRPIIALTAHAMKYDREKCLAAGADDYLAKPVSNTDLFTTLNKWL